MGVGEPLAGDDLACGVEAGEVGDGARFGLDRCCGAGRLDGVEGSVGVCLLTIFHFVFMDLRFALFGLSARDGSRV